MQTDDYNKIYKLWCSIKGLGIRSIDDSEENIVRFIKRNPTTSFVAENKDKIIAKPNCGEGGKGIKLIKINKNIKKTYNDLIKELIEKLAEYAYKD